MLDNVQELDKVRTAHKDDLANFEEKVLHLLFNWQCACACTSPFSVDTKNVVKMTHLLNAGPC